MVKRKVGVWLDGELVARLEKIRDERKTSMYALLSEIVPLGLKAYERERLGATVQGAEGEYGVRVEEDMGKDWSVVLKPSRIGQKLERGKR